MAADYPRGFMKHFSSAIRLRSKQKGGGGGAYDDVLITPPSFTPLGRDYAEIFNSPQASSIPFLELDQLGVDHSSSKVDYGNVFGDGQIGWTHVFCAADGARRTDDSFSHSRGSDHSTALEESQKQYLFGWKHNMSSDIIPREEKAKNIAVSLSINATYETVPLKTAEVNTSGAAVKDLKRCSDEALGRKHSGSTSSAGLSRCETEEFIEIDVRSRIEYVPDKSVSSGKSMEADTIRSEEQTLEAITPSDFVHDFGSPNHPLKEQGSLRSNLSEDQCDVSTSSSQEGVKIESLEKPFIRDSATDDNASRQNPLSQDHGGACATPEILMGNLNACSSNASEKTGDGSYNSHQDVKFQAASGLRLPFITSNQINASVAIPQEPFELAPQTHSQHDCGKLNTAAEEDIVLKIVVSRNAYSECNDRANLQNKVLDELTSIDFPVGTEVINLESQSSETISPSAVQCNLCNVDPALKISTKLQSGVFEKRSDSSSPDDHVRSSSDDEIDKNSEAGIYASAVKKAIREAQVWIKIAKESDGVKGFMKPAVTKTFRQVKEFKEVRDSKVKEISKCFELGRTSIADNFRMSANRNKYIDPLSTSSEIKTTLTNNDGEDIAFKRALFSVPDTEQQKADGVVDSSLEETLEVASTIQYKTPCINISEEKLTMYDNECFKSVPEKGYASMLGMGESGHFGMVEEAKCYEVPKVEKTEILVIPTDNHEALFNNFDDTNTVTGINDAENACHHTKNLRGQGFMKSSFHNDFGQSPVGWSAIDIEVKDLVCGTGNMTVHLKQNEGTNADSESSGTPSSGNFENDLTNLEEGRVNEMHLDSHGQVFDSEDFLDYASAEEDLVSSDTDDEIKGKDSNLPAQYQISEIEDPAMQNMVAPEVISIREDAFGPCFSNLREEPAVEESCESETVPLQNTVTHETKVTPKEMAALILVSSTEDLVVGEGDEKEAKKLQTTGTHNVVSEAMTELFFKISENYAVGKDTDVIVDVPILNSLTPETDTNTSEDGMAPGFNCVDEYPRVENTDGIEAMIGKNMVIPDENNISMNDNEVFLSFDHSNVDLMVSEIEAGTTKESIVSSINQEFNGVAGDKASYIPEYKKLAIEELEGAPSVEFAPIVDYAHPYSDGSEAEPIRADSVTGEYVARTDKDSRSLSRIHDDEKQEMEAACFSDLDSRTQDRKELHAVGIIEAEIIEKGHETKNVKSFINDQASVDGAAAQQDAIDSETIPLYPERDTHEVEAGINFCRPLSDIIMNDDTIELEQQGENWISEPVEERINFCERLSDIIMNDETTEVEQQGENWISEPVDSVLEPEKQLGVPLRDTIKSKATCEFEKQGGNSVQPVERHERKKWEIPKESFERLEMKVGTLEIQHTGEKDNIEVKRQMDKNERKKWEIPVETFELPVLGGNGILEEEEEIEGQERDHSAKSAEKPGRKKWKVQKEVYEAPVLCGEAVGQTSEQDGLVVITASEEEMMMYTLPTNLMHSEETSQDYIFPNEIFAKEELVAPVNGVLSGFCVDSLEACLAKKSLSGMKILDEEEKEKHLNKTSDRLEEEIEEGKSDKQGECAKVCEDVNVKDEIKRTLGMLWKRMYKSKHDEDFETMRSDAQEEEVFVRVMDKDLNLNGPVELVESPKQQDGIAFFNFSGQSSGSHNNTEETSYLKQFEVNGSKSCSGAEFVSITRVTVEVHGNTSSASDSCELQEDGKKSWANETCKQNYKKKASDPASHSEDIRPSNGSENLIEMAQTHIADELQHGQAPQTDIFPSDVNECGRIDCEIMSRFETLLPDESFKRGAENAQKVKLLLQENESKEDETIKTISMGKALQENDGEHYSEGEVEGLLAVEISDRTSTNSEQQDMTSRRQDSVSALDCRVADGMPSHEPKPNSKDEFGPDSSWKGLFREEEESRNKSTKQNEASEISVSPKEKADIRKLAGEINMSQLTVKEKLDDENSSKAEVRAKEGFHKEVTLNHEVLQNILRTKERANIAVERAIRWAFAEAREGADMENGEAEARQKSAISKQEKLVKALIEIKLAAEEISLETKQKAELERAAIERATAEARQRALEKVLSQKDQTSKSSSSGLADASDYHYGSTSEDKHNDGGSSESALRFKATNERHQRIAERTAKALDEKNMRDLLVQREQAERNSLADVLDAEVKRWANGKTGNLRALLSTLQYVLGPDSGWKPIHLTDIVATDALKKAYRKATLCVHPDKLQQRGANIKQKYICEKVFDLLKEAWKRVDRDER